MISFVQITNLVLAIGNIAVLVLVLREYWQARAERIRRKELEISEALYDAQTVRNARYIVSALETYPECFPCREAIDRNLDKRLDRYRLHPK